MIDREAVNAEVRALERLDLDGLRRVWRERYGPAPKLRSPELLGLMLAWRIQAEAFGGLDAATRRKLKTDTSADRNCLDLVPGTVLTREWKGVPEKVRRTEAGYEWRGRVYRSLTAVARAISGRSRSGPLFFGLKEAA
ncbi:DUF2924 domain-containing protein [Brevundimonas sp.]|uniref:DUF2924 domain-containing protein n=1 Tax=Brevundimonas sp. TaxID=1871086 RepID=UPI002D3805E6|nr:DUF2924 domain-containing protein [Brevundimonas sp.]HYC99387.1 DUF2924 domain-containing protein [Brevundimonas sp.]